MAKYLVTGGAGFIGLNLVHHLCAAGEKVVVFDDYSTSKKKYLRDLPKDVKVTEGSVLELKEIKKVVRSCDYVVHLAGMASVLRSVKEPENALQINGMGTLNALIAARDGKVKRFIYIGSATAYGESPSLPKVETMNDAPLSPHAVSTIAAENQCRVFFNTYGLQTVVLRAFNVYGPFQESTGPYAPVVGRFITTLLEGKPPVVAGDGKQSRDRRGPDRGDQVRVHRAEGRGRAVQHRHREPHHRERPRQHHQRAPGQGDPTEVRGGAPGRHPALARRHHEGAGDARLPPAHLRRRRPPFHAGVVPEERMTGRA